MKVIRKFLKNPLRNFNYIIYSESTREAIFVDPLDLSQTLPLCEKEGLTPKYLINTHDHPSHRDHFQDNEKFLKIEGTQKLELKDGEEFFLSGNESIQCIESPGHTPEHKCYLVKNNGVPMAIIAGDTLFNAGVGNCKLGGDVETLYQTTKNLFEMLPDDILLYPSHDYFLSNLEFSLTVDKENSLRDKYKTERLQMDLDNEFMTTNFGEEKKINPFLRVFDPEFQKQYADLSEKEIFLKFRSLRDNW